MLYKHIIFNFTKLYLGESLMKEKKLRNEKGIAGTDALIAILIITLFAGIIGTLVYNIYISNTSLKRMSTAVGYVTDVFEYIDKTYYDDVTQASITNYFNQKYYYDGNNVARENAQVKMDSSINNIDTPYKAVIEVTKYSDTDPNADIDVVEEIEMWVTYRVGNKEQTINMTTLKKREILSTPNIPNISLINMQQNENIYPIKNTDNLWEICGTDDEDWYNYNRGLLPLAIVTSSTYANGTQINAEEEDVYTWIPRFAYNESENDILFLFSNTNKYLEDINGVKVPTQLPANYVIPQDFIVNGVAQTGTWTNSENSEAFEIISEVY